MERFSEKYFSVAWLYLAVFTTGTVLLWIVFDVFRALTTPTNVPEITAAELAPLTNTLNLEALTQIRVRQHVPQEVLDQVRVSSPTIGEVSVTEATESVTINETKGATESGTL